MKKSPMQIVADAHGGKEKLVDKILPLLEKVVGLGAETKEALKKRLQSSANAKLMRLLRTLDEIEKKFGSRDKLAEAYINLVGRAKDAEYVKAVGQYAPGRLLDLYRSVERRLSRKSKKKAA